MALTKDCKDNTIQARAQRDAAFRKALLRKVAQGLLRGGLQWAIFPNRWQDFLHMVFLMVLPPTATSKSLMLSQDNGTFTIEWE